MDNEAAAAPRTRTAHPPTGGVTDSLEVAPVVAPGDEQSSIFERRFRKFLVDAIASSSGARGAKQELAAKIGVSPEHLSRLAAGTRAPSMELARKAAAAFGFDAELYFFSSRTTGDLSYRDFIPGSAEDALDIARRVLAAASVEPSGANAEDVLALASAVLRMPLVHLAREVSTMSADDPALARRGSQLAIELVHFDPRKR